MAYVDYRLTRKQLLAAKAETTRGTYNAPAAADVFEVINLGFPQIGGDPLTWDTFRDTLTRDPDAVKNGTITATITFTTAFPLAAISGAAMTTYLANFGRFFNACGMQGVISTDMLITPDDDAVAGLSILFNIDGIAYQLRGCSGGFELLADAGQFYVINWEFEGVVSDVLEAAPLAVTSIVSQTPEVVESIGLFSIDDGTTTIVPCIKTLSTKCATTRAPYYCQAGGKGIAYYYISDRNITASIVTGPAHDGADQADDELVGMWQANSALTIYWSKAATLSDPGASIELFGHITKLQPGDDNGMFRWYIDLQAAKSVIEGELLIRNYVSVPL